MSKTNLVYDPETKSFRPIEETRSFSTDDIPMGEPMAPEAKDVTREAQFDPETGEVPIDSKGRRSYLSSIAYGPSLGKNIGLGYLPHELCQEGREFITEYLGEQFPMKLESVGYKPLYDPENKLPRS